MLFLQWIARSLFRSFVSLEVLGDYIHGALLGSGYSPLYDVGMSFVLC